MSRLRNLARKPPVIAGGVALLALLFVVAFFVTRARAVPVLQPIYEIETVSNGRTNKLAGLEMGQPGVLQVPSPVDLDGDALPDVLVSVNLVEVSAALADEPLLDLIDEDNPANLDPADLATTAQDVADTIVVPNIQVVRDPTAVAAGRASPPAKIQVKLTVRDVSLNPRPDVVVRFGYDTGNDGTSPKCPEPPPGGPVPPCQEAGEAGRIGSIPQHFQALVRGINSPEVFNPLIAEVTTKEGPVVNPLGTRRDTYEGPIDLVASISEDRPLTKGGLGDAVDSMLGRKPMLGTALRFGYKPFPGTVRVLFGNGRDVERDASGEFAEKPGQHVLYEHTRKDEVDLDTRVVMFGQPAADFVLPRSVIEARVDRLPRHIKLDVQTGEAAGSVDYKARSDGRRPDVSIRVANETVELKEMDREHAMAQAKLVVAGDLEDAGVKLHSSATLSVSGSVTDTMTIVGEPVEGVAPLFAELDIESLPPDIHVDYAFPPTGAKSATFCAGMFDPTKVGEDRCGADAVGIGAVEADVRNFRGSPTVVDTPVPFVPESQQFMSLQNADLDVDTSESLIRGRVERVRYLSFSESADGFKASAKVGDGEAPLQVHFARDDTRVVGASGDGDSGSSGPSRPCQEDADGGGGGGGTTDPPEPGQPTGATVMAFTSTVVPLPDAVSMELRQACPEESSEPLYLEYNSSKSVDVRASVQVLEEITGVDGLPACGQIGSICGDLNVRHIPSHIKVNVRKFLAPVPDLAPPGEQLFPETRIDVDAVPFDGAAKPDFFFDARIGQEDTTPTDFADDIPLVVHAELRGFAEFIRIRAREGLDETLDRVEFHACDYLYEASPPSCTPATKDGRIDAVSFSLRNWEGDRPANLPILVPETPLYATLAGAGAKHVVAGKVTDIVRFEAGAQITDISEAQYRNTGKIFGLRSRIGANKDMSAKVDLRNIVFQGQTDPISLNGDALVTPIPGSWDFCLRQPHQQVGSLSDEFTDQCEQPPASFGGGSQPLSIGFNANTPFDVEARGRLVAHGPDLAGVDDDFRVSGYVKVADLPSVLEAHFDSPKSGEEGPILFESTSNSSVTVDFEAEAADGDLVCEDPRVAPLGKQSLCARGRIKDLPNKTFFKFDPTDEEDNLLLDTDGGQIDVVGLGGSESAVLSRVASQRKGPQGTPDHDVIIPNVLVAEARLENLPDTVTGTINLPGTLEIQASPEVGKIDATVRNFIIPDPMPTKEPTRQVRPDLSVGPDDPGLKVVVFGRKDVDTGQLLFKATAHVEAVRGFAYKTAKDAQGRLLDTRLVTADFGTDQVIRVYADVDEGTRHIVGDLVLPIPRGMDFCFRGKKETAGTPVAPTFCDQAPSSKDEGAFQFVQRGNEEMDVHAFVRYSTGAGADVLSARADIVNIPKVVQGTFRSGSFDAAGYSDLVNGFGQTPDGIDRISFHAATFDLDDHGYPKPPFDPRFVESGPFPAGPPDKSRQHVGLAAAGDLFEARGRIGEVEGGPDTVAASDLRRIRFKKGEVCPKPTGYGTRADFPLYPANPPAPADPIWNYTCIRGDFETLGSGPDPLDMDVDVELEGQRLKLEEAGLTDIPEFFQVNVAEGPSTDANGLRPPCRRPSQSAPNCAPPFLRIDTPGATDLFGFAEVGVEGDLQKLRERQPYVPASEAPDFDASPGEFGCGWQGAWGNCGSADLAKRPRGVRAKLGIMEGGGKAIQAGLRLPIPAGITVDQILSWSESQLTPRYFEASDFRFGYTTADANGNAINNLGQAAALIHKFDDGMQILVGDAFDPQRGLLIPGDLAIALYDRNLKGSGRQFLQIDGRVNVALDIGARVFLAGGGLIDGKVLNVPATTGSEAPGAPSFRIRAEINKDAEPPPTGDEGSSGDEAGGGGEVEEDEDCTPLLCFKKEFALKKVDAMFDFAPTGTPARLLEAVLRLGGDKNGAEVIGWSTVTGKKPDGSLADRVNFEANVDVLVQPINIFFHAGIPVIGSLDFVLMSDLQAGVAINGNRLMLRHNLMHLRARVDSSAGLTGDLVDFLNPFLDPPCITTTSCLYVDYRIYHLHGIAFSILGLLWGNPILLGVDFLPPSLPRGILPAPLDPTAVNITFRPCPGLDAFPPPFEARMLSLPSGIDRNVVVWLDDPRLFFYGTLGPLFQGAKFMADLLAPLFCFLPVGDEEIPLIRGTAPGAADRFPGDPLGLAGHPVPDVEFTSVEAPKEKVVVEPFPSLTVKSGETVDLCGDWAFNNVTVEAGGTLRTATAAVADPLIVEVKVAEEGAPPSSATTELRPVGAKCHPLGAHPGHQAGDDPPEENRGQLKLTATGDVTIGGTVVGADRALSLVAGKILRVQSGATVSGGTGKVTLAAGDDLFVRGSVHADEVLTVPPPGAPVASGNSGGGHGGRGGDGGFGSGGAQFGDEGFDGILDGGTPTDDGQVGTEGGAPGSSINSRERGRGGGTITLIAGNELWIITGGEVSADGGGGQNGVDACDTGLSGAGGGAGGGIVLSAPRVAGGGTVAARGGDGGDGRSGGGGGAGGRIKLITPLLGSFLTVDTTGGLGGTSGCADFDDSDPGEDGEEPHDPRPQSSALPFAEGFWQRGRDFPFGTAPVDDELDVGYSAAAGAPAGMSDDFYVVTCGQYIAPDRPELDLIKNADLANGPDYDGSDNNTFKPDGIGTVMQKLMPPADSVTIFHPCGTFGSPFSPPDGFGFGSPLSPVFPFGTAEDPLVLGTRFVENRTTSTGTVEATELPTPLANAGDNRLNGFWGVWSIVIKPKHDLGDCIFNSNNCFFEQVPRTPDFVFGYDNNLASFEFGLANLSERNEADTALVTNSRNVVLSLTGQSDTMARQHPKPPIPQPEDDDFVDLSGVKEAHCANNPDAADDFVICSDDWKLPVQDRTNVVRAHLLDQAGNITAKETKVILDTTPPTSAGTIVVPSSVNQLNNGWYDGSPHFKLSAFNDPDSPHDADANGFAGFKEYRYRFDDGREHVCTQKVCIIGDDAAEQPLLPGPGRHTFSWYAVDRAGNKQAVQTLAVKIDADAPLTAFSTVATAPNGANDWFVTRTHGAVSTFDRPPGGSGFSIPAGELPGDGSQFGVFYGIAPFPAFPAPTTAYTTPFEIPAGIHRVCWKAIDVAGHSGVVVNDAGVELGGFTLGTHKGVHCTGAIKVDLKAPDVTIVPAPGAPNGENNWYVGAEPSVTIAVNEALPGSGVGDDDDPTLCEGAPLRIDPPGAPRSSGVCVSIDGSRFKRHDPAAAITIAEGVHTVRAFAVDRSGQQSEVAELVLKVDLSSPVTTLRMRPPFPAVDAGWWRRVPTAVLRATDGEANAGVRDIPFGLDGSPGSAYTGPFPVSGDSLGHVLSFFANDLSGPSNQEPEHQAIIKVDTTPVIVTATRPTLAGDSGEPSALDPAPVVWNPLLHGNLRLNWTAECSSFAGAVRARVIVYNLLGQVAAVIEDSVLPEEMVSEDLSKPCNGGATHPAAHPTTVHGVTEWNGTDDSLLSPDDPLLGLDLVPAGIYWYRVVVVDEAGHVAQSGESHPLQVVIGQE